MYESLQLYVYTWRPLFTYLYGPLFYIILNVPLSNCLCILNPSEIWRYLRSRQTIEWFLFTHQERENYWIVLHLVSTLKQYTWFVCHLLFNLKRAPARLLLPDRKIVQLHQTVTQLRAITSNKLCFRKL